VRVSAQRLTVDGLQPYRPNLVYTQGHRELFGNSRELRSPKIPGGNFREFLKFWRKLRGIYRSFVFFFQFLANVRYVIVRPSVCRLSVTFVHPTQAIEIFDNVSTLFGTMAIY